MNNIDKNNDDPDKDMNDFVYDVLAQLELQDFSSERQNQFLDNLLQSPHQSAEFFSWLESQYEATNRTRTSKPMKKQRNSMQSNDNENPLTSSLAGIGSSPFSFTSTSSPSSNDINIMLDKMFEDSLEKNKKIKGLKNQPLKITEKGKEKEKGKELEGREDKKEEKEREGGGKEKEEEDDDEEEEQQQIETRTENKTSTSSSSSSEVLDRKAITQARISALERQHSLKLQKYKKESEETGKQVMTETTSTSSSTPFDDDSLSLPLPPVYDRITGRPNILPPIPPFSFSASSSPSFNFKLFMNEDRQRQQQQQQPQDATHKKTLKEIQALKSQCSDLVGEQKILKEVIYKIQQDMKTMVGVIDRLANSNNDNRSNNNDNNDNNYSYNNYNDDSIMNKNDFIDLRRNLDSRIRPNDDIVTSEEKDQDQEEETEAETEIETGK